MKVVEEASMQKLISTLKSPVVVTQSETSQLLQQSKYARMRYEAMRAKFELRATMEKELELLDAKISQYNVPGQQVPPFYLSKQLNLVKEIADLNSENVLPHIEPMSSPPVPSSTSPHNCSTSNSSTSAHVLPEDVLDGDEDADVCEPSDDD